MKHLHVDIQKAPFFEFSGGCDLFHLYLLKSGLRRREHSPAEAVHLLQQRLERTALYETLRSGRGHILRQLSLLRIESD